MGWTDSANIKSPTSCSLGRCCACVLCAVIAKLRVVESDCCCFRCCCVFAAAIVAAVYALTVFVFRSYARPPPRSLLLLLLLQLQLSTSSSLVFVHYPLPPPPPPSPSVFATKSLLLPLLCGCLFYCSCLRTAQWYYVLILSPPVPPFPFVFGIQESCHGSHDM